MNMADTDEAAIQNNATPVDIDLSDETQDFRMLNHLSFLADTSSASLPKRGEKDFEPNRTGLQADILSTSRQAMHNALAYPRLHHPRTRIVGIYAPDGPAPPRGVDSTTSNTTATPTAPTATKDKENDAQTTKPTKPGVGMHPDVCVYVESPKGGFFKAMGQADRWNRMWLLPEEALYLLERGSLEIRWPRSLTGCDAAGDYEDEDSGIPMSLQAAYAAFIGHGGLSIERYSVYSGLRRLGYTLVRAPGWIDDRGEYAEDIAEGATETKTRGPGLAGLFGQFLQWFQGDATDTTPRGPVAGLGIHRSYDDIYRKLSIIPWYDPVAHRPATSSTAPPYQVVLHVYKPSTAFRKTAPPPPDFRIAVINARTHTTMPTMAQLGSLLDSTPLDPPKGEKMDRMLYLRLRHGHRNIVLAVVDQGVVSYLRVAEAAFGKEKIYTFKPSAGSKKGGFRPKPKS